MFLCTYCEAGLLEHPTGSGELVVATLSIDRGKFSTTSEYSNKYLIVLDSLFHFCGDGLGFGLLTCFTLNPQRFQELKDLGYHLLAVFYVEAVPHKGFH